MAKGKRVSIRDTTTNTTPETKGEGRSLREHNKAAISRTETPSKPAREQSPTPPRGGGEASTLTARERLGIRMPDEEWAAARSAYLSDWNAGGDADTFMIWISGVIDSYVRRPASAAEPAMSGATWQTKTFLIPVDVLERLRNAVTERQTGGEMTSQNEMARRAIAAAVQVATEREGGTLPPVTGRLPNKLRR